MIQPLRVVHRRAFVALALVLPAILLIGLGARRPRLGPSAHATDVPDTGNMVRESSTLWQKHSIQSRFYRKSDRPQDIVCRSATGGRVERAGLAALLGYQRTAGKRSACGGATSGRLYHGQGLSSSAE